MNNHVIAHQILFDHSQWQSSLKIPASELSAPSFLDDAIMTDSSSELINSWLQELYTQKHLNYNDNPNYWVNDPSTLCASSSIFNLALGTGSNVLDTILPALESTEHELIFVTCFWANSTSLTALSSTLKHLSSKAISRKDNSKIRVRICLSSVSLFQKLFHTSSPSGYIYPPSTWTSKLHLPPPNELKGLDLQIKSVFILPFSVMHPKFIIVDRKRAWLPSCNVSWESWFEGCVELEGPIVNKMVDFWRSFWGRNDLPALPTNSNQADSLNRSSSPERNTAAKVYELPHTPITTIFLPSPHRRNPKFRPFLAPSTPPPTPLNTFLVSLINSAKTSIYIQTPNLTSPPVLTALQNALARGIDVSILTNTRMMLLEQLVTAGTTTELCVRRLSKWHRHVANSTSPSRVADLESGITGQAHGIGTLNVRYYTPNAARPMQQASAEPVKSHLKLTIVDDEIVVLGSGNMDRASWYTSQEVGIAFFSREVATEIMHAVKEEMIGRSRLYK